jgi:hypothetical protein
VSGPGGGERSSFHGVGLIVRFNWPFYVVAVAVNLVVGALLVASLLPRPLGLVAIAAAGVSDGWLLVSLVVSHYIYDRSGVARGDWAQGLAAASVDTAAVFHAGHDEASAVAREELPGVSVQVFDFFDPTRNTEASLRRARSLAGDAARATPIKVDAVPLESGSLSLGCIVFAAHEIRAAAERTTFFQELSRVLAPGGRLIVVEHLRDGWNALAYGPASLHFLSRGAWLRTFMAARLVIRHESRITPFVTVFELERAA